MKVSLPSRRYKRRDLLPVEDQLSIGSSNRLGRVIIATHEVYVADLLKAIEQVSDEPVTEALTEDQRDAIRAEDRESFFSLPENEPDPFIETTS